MNAARIVRVGALALWFIAANALAQEQRDPTTPPPEAAAATAGGSAKLTVFGESGASVVVRDGKPYLVVGTRLVAVGQKLGQAKLERITETEIWLREGGALQKLPRFAGVQRHVSVAPVCGAPLRSKDKDKVKRPASSTPPAVPCVGANP